MSQPRTPGDDEWTAKLLMTCRNMGLPTIHRPYYNYYLFYLFLYLIEQVHRYEVPM